MNNMEWFVAQSKVAEANLVRLALIAEKHIANSSEMHDLVNDCLTSSALLREARQAAQPGVQRTANETCEWKLEDDEEGVWYSACGDAWIFEEGTPEDNHMKFCPYCGRNLTMRAADVCPRGGLHDWLFPDDDDIETCEKCGTRR